MDTRDLFFNALKINTKDKLSLSRFARTAGISVIRLNHYNSCNKIPSGTDLQRICGAAGITEAELMLKMGVFDYRITSIIQKNADQIYQLIKQQIQNNTEISTVPPLVYETKLGKLYQGDCLDLMRNIDGDSVDLIFADPPFNLNKLYPSKIDDNLKSGQYSDVPLIYFTFKDLGQLLPVID